MLKIRVEGITKFMYNNSVCGNLRYLGALPRGYSFPSMNSGVIESVFILIVVSIISIFNKVKKLKAEINPEVSSNPLFKSVAVIPCKPGLHDKREFCPIVTANGHRLHIVCLSGFPLRTKTGTKTIFSRRETGYIRS